MLMIRKPKCENNDITTIRTSSEPHLRFKDHSHKNTLYFESTADFEGDNAIEDSKAVGNKTTIFLETKFCS